MITSDLDIQWPASGAEVDLGASEHLGDGRVRLVRLAVCDDQGRPSRFFAQGETAHFYMEFDVDDDLAIASAGIVIYDDVSHVAVFGKNSFQHGTGCPVAGGTRVRCHETIVMALGIGGYTLDVGLATCPEDAYNRYVAGELAYTAFSGATRECCRVRAATTLAVTWRQDGRLTHHGLADLPGSAQLAQVDRPVTRVADQAGQAAAVLAAPAVSTPTILHVTHWKAGSQWIHKILVQCVPDLIVAPAAGQAQIFHWPVKPGAVYPTVYASRAQMNFVKLPPDTRIFVMIRDLRDTLVSAYFSFGSVHPVLDGFFSGLREALVTLPFEEGMIFLMDDWLAASAQIQLSWLDAGYPLIRYEDLLGDDTGILERVLIDHCQLPVSRERFREVVEANRFERLTGGRRRGEEDRSAHERKGQAGDWRNHLNDRLKRAFKARFGGALVAAGYEKDLDW